MTGNGVAILCILGLSRIHLRRICIDIFFLIPYPWRFWSWAFTSHDCTLHRYHWAASAEIFHLRLSYIGFWFTSLNYQHDITSVRASKHGRIFGTSPFPTNRPTFYTRCFHQTWLGLRKAVAVGPWSLRPRFRFLFRKTRSVLSPIRYLALQNACFFSLV
jgi:hypothetical protein